MMFCQNCGSQLPPSAKACPACGSSKGLSNRTRSGLAVIITLVLAFLIVVAVGIGIVALVLYQENETVKQQETQKQTQIPQEDVTQRQREREGERAAQRAKIVMDNLSQDMSRVAETEARPRHTASNLEGCYSSASDVETISKTPDRVEFVRLFKCRMKGAIFGVRTFEVGVKVRGEVVKTGNDFSGTILGSWVVSDTGG